jgi:hypothetical protein
MRLAPLLKAYVPPVLVGGQRVPHSKLAPWEAPLRHSLVTPGLLFGVNIRVVLVTHALPKRVELCCIFLKKVTGCQVTTAAKPGLPSNLA